MVFVVFFNTSDSSFSQSSLEFIQSNGVEINKDYIVKNLRFYMNRRYRNETLQWQEGAIISNDGSVYNNIKLKYNTIDNSINVKINEKYFQLYSNRIKGFDIKNKGNLRSFRRGFFENRKHEISAYYTIGAIETLAYLTAYSKIENFKILHLETSKQKHSDGILNVEFLSPSNNATYALQSYLQKNNGLKSVLVSTNGKGIDEMQFFEILVDGKNGKLLKTHSKRSGQNDSVTLAKVSDPTVVTFDEHEYYLSNSENDIQHFFFNKKSIKKALDFIEIEPKHRIPSFSTERKLISYFRKTL